MLKGKSIWKSIVKKAEIIRCKSYAKSRESKLTQKKHQIKVPIKQLAIVKEKFECG